MNYEEVIGNVCKTLDTIPVSGLENMDKMLGIYTVLTQIIDDMKKKKEETQA